MRWPYSKLLPGPFQHPSRKLIQRFAVLEHFNSLVGGVLPLIWFKRRGWFE
ncbi:hypothetical protein JJC00_26000 [Bradyrhizobium diazoefficiens]|uniref:hypothetical protein n=1 Tax=Bradyrhizobium diazoefficiens TaxID=1355477 RepID=UPI00190D90C5|nr:hypothetical protein [Bradyrhizobium diazoefficiens]QQO32030.1 hypothetical protein JJC00_26000 [Bradyrhizobium diazoefficiens]